MESIFHTLQQSKVFYNVMEVRNELVGERKELLEKSGNGSKNNKCDRMAYKAMFGVTGARAMQMVNAKKFGTIHNSLNARAQAKLNFVTVLQIESIEAIDSSLTGPPTWDAIKAESTKRVTDAMPHIMKEHPGDPNLTPDQKKLILAKQFKHVKVSGQVLGNLL